MPRFANRAKAIFLRLDALWRSGWTACILLAISAFFIIFWYIHTPSPGKAVAALAVVATGLSFRPNMCRAEKALWMAVLFVFLHIEILAIDHDREDSNQKQLGARAAQDAKFAEVLRQERHSLAMTMDSMRGLTYSSQKNLNVVTKSLALITGGESRLEFRVQIANASSPMDAHIALFPIVIGTAPLRSVSIGFGQSGCQVYPKTGLAELGGLQTFSRTFESFTGMNMADPRSTIAEFPLKTRRAVFFGQAKALNGYWSYIIKLRFISGTWEWRDVTYNYKHHDSMNILSDITSSGFPVDERKRPILPGTADDCVEK